MAVSLDSRKRENRGPKKKNNTHILHLYKIKSTGDREHREFADNSYKASRYIHQLPKISIYNNMVRADYSTDASSVPDESTFASSAHPQTSDEVPTSEEYTDDGHHHHANELPRYATHKPSRAKKSNINISGLNRRLRTEYIDVDPNDDSIMASLIRGIVGLVGSCFTPRQILVALRLLKAITVAFIALTMVANIVYITFVEFVPPSNNSSNHNHHNPYLGQRRDTVLRIYGLGFGTLALLIELDKFVMKNFKVLKGFLARFGLLFFVASVTYCHPKELSQYNDYNRNGNYDDDGSSSSGGSYYNSMSSVPMSAVVFQMVSSSVL